MQCEKKGIENIFNQEEKENVIKEATKHTHWRSKLLENGYEEQMMLQQ